MIVPFFIKKIKTHREFSLLVTLKYLFFPFLKKKQLLELLARLFQYSKKHKFDGLLNFKKVSNHQPTNWIKVKLIRLFEFFCDFRP